MTPDHARTLWCPHARAAQSVIDQKGEEIDAVTVNRGVDGKADKDCLCLADRCMAWRWKTDDDGYCGLVPHLPTVEKTP